MKRTISRFKPLSPVNRGHLIDIFSSVVEVGMKKEKTAKKLAIRGGAK